MFVAIELDDHVRRALVELRSELKRAGGDVRWVRPEQLHLTVKFLGEVPDAQVAEVCDAVTQAVADTSPFEFEASGCGCFPSSGPARVIWAGSESAPAGLLGCVEAVERQLERIGFPREQRRFSPHVTLGRVNQDRSRGRLRSAIESAGLDRLSQDVSSIVVMSSVLSRGGPSYAVVSRAEFGEV